MQYIISSQLALSVCVAVFLLEPAIAQTAPGNTEAPSKNCLEYPLRLPGDATARFSADPAGILTTAPTDPAERDRFLYREVRRLVGSDVAILPAVKMLVASASEQDKKTVGRALGQAALLCATTKPALGLEIQSFIASLEDRSVVEAFLAGSREIDVGSLGLFGGGGAAGGGASITQGSVGSATNWQVGSVRQSGGVATFGASGFSAGGFTRVLRQNASVSSLGR